MISNYYIIKDFKSNTYLSSYYVNSKEIVTTFTSVIDDLVTFKDPEICRVLLQLIQHKNPERDLHIAVLSHWKGDNNE